MMFLGIEENIFEVLSEIKQPSLIIGIDTDILYPIRRAKGAFILYAKFNT